MKTATNSEVIGRIRYLMQSASLSQAAFARRIGIDASNVSKYLSGRLPLSESLLNRIIINLGVSASWLKYGEGIPYEKPGAPAQSGISAQSGAIPLYDIDVAAGTWVADRAFTDENRLGYVCLPDFNPHWVMIRANGESMTPVISDGSYIAILPENDIDNIMWGQIYVVIMETRRVVKYVRRHKDSSKVILKSANANYDPMEVELRSIVALYPVKAIVNIRMCL